MDDHKDTNENPSGGEHQQDDSSHQHEHGEHDEGPPRLTSNG